MNPQSLDLEALKTELKAKNPRVILKKALASFDKIAIAFSGADDVVVIDMAHQIDQEIRVFTLDTGRLHAETYRYIESVRKHYGIDIEVLYPDPEPLRQLVKNKGLFSFYEDGHEECCGLRKIAPLRQKVVALDAWITGQRRDQSLATRQELGEVEADSVFSREDHPVIKFNPLANWSSQQVWDYIEAYQVPFNPLHRQGYMSIGCEPCTRPILPHQHEREGRWWWESDYKKECGLHAHNPRSA